MTQDNISLSQLNDHEIFQVFSLFLERKFIEKKLEGESAVIERLHMVLVIINEIMSEGFIWFCHSDFNLSELYSSINFFDEELTSEFREILPAEERELTEEEEELLDNLYKSLENIVIDWVKQNEELLSEYSSELSNIYHNEVLPINERMKKLHSQEWI